MIKEKENKLIIKSIVAGRLYIPTNLFFKQPKIQQMVQQLMNSEIFKEIENKKSRP